MGLISKFIRISRTDGIGSAINRTHSFINQIYQRIYGKCYGAIHGETVVKETQGGYMKVDVGGSLFFENESREKIGHKVEDIISDLSRTSQDLFFFELGAHHGYYTLLASKLINNGRCIAVEPSPMNVSRIEENINLNGYNNIEIENVAVGSKKEDKRLAILETSQRHRFLKDCHQDEPKRTVPVTVLPFDNIASKYNIPKDSPVILRIDTEYHEKEVLNGMGRFLSTTRPIYIIMEVHNTEAYSGYPAVKTLYEHGFSLQYIDEKIAGNNKNLLKDMQNREENVEILAIRRPEDDGS